MTAILALLACARERCDTTTVEVGDDAPLGDLAFTAADVLAGAEGARAFPADLDGRILETDLVLARDEGAAVLRDAEWIGRDGYTCQDAVDVPVTVTLTTADGAVDLAVSSHVTAGNLVDLDDALGLILLEVELGADAGLDPAPEAGSRPELYLRFADGLLHALTVEWAGGGAEHLLEHPPETP